MFRVNHRIISIVIVIIEIADWTVGRSGKGLSFDIIRIYIERLNRKKAKEEYTPKDSRKPFAHQLDFFSVNPKPHFAGIVSSDNIPGLLYGYATKCFIDRIAQTIREQEAADSVQEQLASD